MHCSSHSTIAFYHCLLIMSLFVIKDKRFVTFSFYLVRAYQEGILCFSPSVIGKSANFILVEMKEGEKERKKSTRIYGNVLEA